VLGQCLTEGDRPEDALPILTELLEYALGNYPANNVEVIQARHELAEAHLKLGVLDEAEAGFRLALAGYGDSFDDLAAAAGARFGLAKIAALRGALDEAATGFTRVLTELMDTAGPWVRGPC
jgi:tetratricopeptide (TPR) repeat protein